MRRTHRNYITLLIGLAFMTGVGAVVVMNVPDWRVELLANGLLLGGMVFIFSWIWGTKKYGVITAVGLWSLLIMGRLGVLDWITFGAWLLLIGLITLVN